MRGSQKGLTFYIWTSGSRDICILVFEKMGFLWTRVKGALYTCSGTKNKLLMFFCSPVGIDPHNFVRNYPIFKSKGLIYATFCRVFQEIFFMLQKSSLWGLGPKN